jgi:hypothetical protein
LQVYHLAAGLILVAIDPLNCQTHQAFDEHLQSPFDPDDRHQPTAKKLEIIN